MASNDDESSLTKEIAALHAKISVAEVAIQRENQRLRGVFDALDSEGRGSLDREELSQLAYEAGLVNLEPLTPANLQSSYDAVDPERSGRFGFEAFERWFRSVPAHPTSPGATLSLLDHLRLLGRMWLRGFGYLREEAVRDQSDPDLPAKRLEREKSLQGNSSDKDMKVTVSVGNCEPVRSSARFAFFPDPERAARERAEAECPADVEFFARIDLGLRSDADDMLVGELCGMIEVVLDAVPWEQLYSLPVHHSHTVDMYEDPTSGEICLRINIFSGMSPGALLTQLAGQLPADGDSPEVLHWGRVEADLEFPHSLADFLADPSQRVTLDTVGGRASLRARINRHVEQRLQGLVSRLPPHMAAGPQVHLASVQFLRGFDAALRFGSVHELVSRLPPATVETGLVQEILRLSSLPVGELLFESAAEVRDMSRSQTELYNTARQALTGLDSIVVVTKDHVATFELEGLDFVPFFPPM